MTIQHPPARSLARLADGGLDQPDGDEVRAHLDGCVVCQGHMAKLRAASPVDLPDYASHVVSTRPWVESPFSDPQAGEVRRISWDWTNELGLIVRNGEDDRVLVRPILRDGVVVDGVSRRMVCGLGQQHAELGVLTCAMWLSTAALDAWVGRCFEQVLSPDDIVTAEEFGRWILSRVEDPEDSVELVDVLVESFEELAKANEWAPPAPVLVPSAEELMDAGLTPGRALQIVRGDAPTPAETSILQERGLDGSDAGLPSNIRSLLNRPKFKQRLRARAAQQEVSEATVRMSLAQQLRVPVAARTEDGRELPLDRQLEELLR